tara:strand:+ start:2129 stop:2785 length:657 start_codon:yes stop_codon:yes gene_type:complete
MKTEELEKTLSDILKGSGNFSITTTRNYQYEDETDSWSEDRKDCINSRAKIPTLDKYLKYVAPKLKNGLTIKKIYRHYSSHCKHINTEPTNVRKFRELFKTQFKPRAKKLNGNTVYDVELLQWTQLDPKQFVEDAEEELERYAQERDFLEAQLARYMQLYESATDHIDELDEEVAALTKNNKYLYEKANRGEFKQLCKDVHQYTGHYRGPKKSIFDYE